MPAPSIVLDSNILVSALRSRRGASFRVVEAIGLGLFEIHITNNLILEYEEVMRRTADQMGLSQRSVDTILAYVYAHAKLVTIEFRVRPFLKDADDDMVVEAAIASSNATIVTHNVADFLGIEQYGLRAIRPGKFLRELGIGS